MRAVSVGISPMGVGRKLTCETCRRRLDRATGPGLQTAASVPRPPIVPKHRQSGSSRYRIRRRYQVFLRINGQLFLRINGQLHYLWRAVDQHGVVLDILVQDRRNATAAKRFFRRLLAGLKYKPRRLVTDGLRSYGVAHRELMPEVKHRTSRYLNNRAENSHQPTRRRERQMQRFKSPEQAQHFLSSHAMIYGHFRPRRHLMTAVEYRNARAKAFRIWRQETCVQMAA